MALLWGTTYHGKTMYQQHQWERSEIFHNLFRNGNTYLKMQLHGSTTDIAYQMSHALRLRKQLLISPQEQAALLREIFHPQSTCAHNKCR